jgi:hypothetical protein
MDNNTRRRNIRKNRKTKKQRGGKDSSLLKKKEYAIETHRQGFMEQKRLEELLMEIDMQLYGNKLLKAAGQGYVSNINKLLKENPELNINVQRRDGNTPLMMAAMNGHLNVVLKLLNKEADVDLQNNNGDTALMLAVRYGRERVVLKLLNKEADVNLENKKGETALQIAKYYAVSPVQTGFSNKYLQIIKAILEYNEKQLDHNKKLQIIPKFDARWWRVNRSEWSLFKMLEKARSAKEKDDTNIVTNRDKIEEETEEDAKAAEAAKDDEKTEEAITEDSMEEEDVKVVNTDSEEEENVTSNKVPNEVLPIPVVEGGRSRRRRTRRLKKKSKKGKRKRSRGKR